MLTREYFCPQFTCIQVINFQHNFKMLNENNQKLYAVAGPGWGGGGPVPPLPLLKLVKKKMATAASHKFHESSPPPRTNFWIRY